MRLRTVKAPVASTIVLATVGIVGCDGHRGAPSDELAHPSVSAAPVPPVAASSTTPGASSAANTLRRRIGPFIIDGAKYFVEIERYAVSGPDTGVKRVVVRDTTDRVVYDEDVAAMVATETESWVEFSAGVLEDARGRARALLFTYGAYPSAPETGVSLRVVVPRAGTLKPLAPLFTYFGTFGPLPRGSQDHSERLLDGDRIVVKQWRYHFAAIVPYHIDLGCAPGAEGCITLVLPDSTAGMARFRVEAELRPIEEATTIELFPSPSSPSSERVTIGLDDKVEVLEGAGNVVPGPSSGSETKGDWLLVRVNGRTGWIHGEATFSAIGLPSAG